MSNWSKSTVYGGIYTKTQIEDSCSECDIKIGCRYRKFITRLEEFQYALKNSREKIEKLSLSIKNNLKNHISEKQELYWPVLISAILLFLVFISRTAFAASVESPNNLPIYDGNKLNLIGFGQPSVSAQLCSANAKDAAKAEKVAGDTDDSRDRLREKVSQIVKNTPMAAMVDAISEKPRPVAAFIVGIAMKESKFGVYSPKKGGRDCYNYWGFKGGGTTVAGGYSCFASPEQAVDAVGGRIEKMVSKGVRTPAQAISWKCGSSCAGHGAANVQKWISDVAINFNKINS